MEASRIYNFRRQHPQGYNYVKCFSIEESQSLDESPRKILIHKNTGGISVHMLAIFNVIHKAHCRLGHLAVDKTLAATKPAFYSPTSRRSYPTIDVAAAAAAAAFADAPEADMDICFCCCDVLAMELVCLTCCMKMIHWQCLLAYLETNSQCCYCRCPVDMAKVMEYETIHRSLPQPLTPVKTPKHDIQQLLIDKKTPLRDADRVRSDLHEKKRMALIEQANRMICH